MFARPVAELASLHGKSTPGAIWTRRQPTNPLAAITGDLFEIRLEAEVGADAVLTMTARGMPIIYDAAKKTLTCGDKSAPLAPESGKVSLSRSWSIAARSRSSATTAAWRSRTV